MELYRLQRATCSTHVTSLQPALLCAFNFPWKKFYGFDIFINLKFLLCLGVDLSASNNTLHVVLAGILPHTSFSGPLEL